MVTIINIIEWLGPGTNKFVAYGVADYKQACYIFILGLYVFPWLPVGDRRRDKEREEEEEKEEAECD